MSYALRRWSTRHARFLERLYLGADRLVRLGDPLWRWIGLQHLERPARAFEAGFKGLFFDCQMCGVCVLSSTGMSCPTNCPKNVRNGPCGGVRADGSSEVEPEMRCVWVEAWEGSQRMQGGAAIEDRLAPIDHDLKGSSAWLRLVRERWQSAGLPGRGAG